MYIHVPYSEVPYRGHIVFFFFFIVGRLTGSLLKLKSHKINLKIKYKI